MDIENKISYDIRGASFKINKALGPGLLESVYETALAHELRKMQHSVKTQAMLPVEYDGILMEQGFRIDLLVDDLVIVEVKSVEALSPTHHKQLLTYLQVIEKETRTAYQF